MVRSDELTSTPALACRSISHISEEALAVFTEPDCRTVLRPKAGAAVAGTIRRSSSPADMKLSTGRSGWTTVGAREIAQRHMGCDAGNSWGVPTEGGRGRSRPSTRPCPRLEDSGDQVVAALPPSASTSASSTTCRPSHLPRQLGVSPLRSHKPPGMPPMAASSSSYYARGWHARALSPPRYLLRPGACQRELSRDGHPFGSSPTGAIRG